MVEGIVATAPRDRVGGALPASASMLRLGLGLADLPAPNASWPEIMRIAVRERCAALCWMRSAEVIRRSAPNAVATEWRTEAFAAAELAGQWMMHLGECVDLLEACGAHPVVLKGLPLAQRLYGTIAVRPSADLDLFIATEEREAAHRALTAAGWTHRFGRAPDEGVYTKHAGGARWLLEVHSSLGDDNLLRHLPLPVPESVSADVEGVRCRAFSGALLPGYLALHFSKHQMPPLLWLLDFHALWTGLSPVERAEARCAARMARIGRYLEHAVRRTEQLERAALGDVGALRACGLTPEGRVETHNAIGVALLAATPADAVRTMAAWLLPHDLRSHPIHLLRRTAWRVRQPLARTFRNTAAQRAAAPPRADHAISIDTPDLLVIVRALTGRGAGLWMSVSGTSMLPAIRAGSRVRLGCVPDRPLRAGEVVLAELPDGQAVVHRVVAEASGEHDRTVRLRGDNNNAEDPPIPRSRVVALVDAIDRDGLVGSVPPARPAIGLTLRRARAGFRTLLFGER